jgi:hypothetical protein
MNYPNASGYKVEFDAPNPAAVQVKVGGTFSNLTNVSVSGNHYTGYVTLQHPGGDLLQGGGEIDLTGASAANPITNFHVIRPGGTLSGITPTYQSYLNDYQAVRWMNNNNVNNNRAPMTSKDLLPPGQNLGIVGNSYDDVIAAANAQANLKKVWINIPVNADDSFVKAAADKFAANLAPGKQVVVEYGNENWNFAFSHPQWILDKAKGDARVTAPDDFTKTAQEAALLSAHVQQIFQGEFADKSRVAGFLGSQGASTWFVDQGKSIIKAVFGPSTLTQLYKYQGISYYPGDNLSSAATENDLINSLYSDLARQKSYLTADKASATGSGLNEAVYEWGMNGYLTKGGVSQAVIDQFRADPRSRQWVLDEWAAIKGALGPNDLAMEFTVLGDLWSAQVNPLMPHEQEQLAIDQIAAGLGITAGGGPLAPEPASLSLLGIGALGLLARRRKRRAA